MFEPGDARDLIRELQAAQGFPEPIGWQTLIDEANKRGVSSTDFQKALSAAKEQGIVIEPKLGEFTPL